MFTHEVYNASSKQVLLNSDANEYYLKNHFLKNPSLAKTDEDLISKKKKVELER